MRLHRPEAGRDHGREGRQGFVATSNIRRVHMAARFATSYVVKADPSNPYIDGWIVDEARSQNAQWRVNFSHPAGAFAVLREWHKDYKDTETCQGVLRRMTNYHYNKKLNKTEPRDFLQLDGAVFVISGTTDDLTHTLGNYCYPFGIKMFACESDDYLDISFARVGKIGALGVRLQTQTLIHIAPHRSWWNRNAMVNDAQMPGGPDWKDPAALKWRSLGPPNNVLKMEILLDWVTNKAQKEDAWIGVKEKYWT
jgi:hypothetical protein